MVLVRVRRPNGTVVKLVVKDERLRDLNPYIEYEIRKSEWLRTHPDAKPEDITRAFTEIAKDLGI